MKVCPTCNKKLSDEVSFCFVCGTLEEEALSTADFSSLKSLPKAREILSPLSKIVLQSKAQIQIAKIDRKKPQTSEEFLFDYNNVSNDPTAIAIKRFIKYWNSEKLRISKSKTSNKITFYKDTVGDFLLQTIDKKLLLVPHFFTDYDSNKKIILENCFEVEYTDHPNKNKIYEVITPVIVDLFEKDYYLLFCPTDDRC